MYGFCFLFFLVGLPSHWESSVFDAISDSAILSQGFSITFCVRFLILSVLSFHSPLYVLISRSSWPLCYLLCFWLVCLSRLITTKTVGYARDKWSIQIFHGLWWTSSGARGKENWSPDPSTSLVTTEINAVFQWFSSKFLVALNWLRKDLSRIYYTV